MTAYTQGDTCPQCNYPIPPSQPSLCPNCQYPLLFEEEDDDREAVAHEQLRRPSQPQPSDQTMINPRVRDEPPVVVPSSQPTGPTRACPMCGWPNALTRARCERCSAAMRVEAPLQPPAPPPPPPQKSSKAWIFIPVAIVLAALLGSGTYWVISQRGGIAGPGPSSPATTATPSEASTSPAKLTKIDSSTITGKASSTLPADSGGSYGISKTLDDSTKTAWESQGSGSAEVKLTYTLAEPAQLGKIDFYNGVQKDKGVYGRNGRVKSLKVSAGGTSHTFTVADTLGKQALTYSFPEATKITLTVTAVYPGSAHADLGITGVVFYRAG